MRTACLDKLCNVQCTQLGVISAYTFCTGTFAVECPTRPVPRAWITVHPYRRLSFLENYIRCDYEGSTQGLRRNTK